MNNKLSVQDVDRCVNEKQNSDSGEMQKTAPCPSTSRVPKDISLTLAEIRERRAKITAPWSLTVPSVEIGYTNGAILWDGEGCNFGEIAPNDNDYEACDFAGENYQNSNATFAANAPTDVDTLLSIIDALQRGDGFVSQNVESHSPASDPKSESPSESESTLVTVDEAVRRAAEKIGIKIAPHLSCEVSLIAFEKGFAEIITAELSVHQPDVQVVDEVSKEQDNAKS